jgi:hypothetical protein
MSDAGNDGEVETQNPTFSNEEENADSSTATADAISTGIGNSLTAADIAARHAALPWSHRVVRTWNTLLGISANSSKFRVTLIGGFVFFTSYVYVLWSVLGQTVYQHTHVQHHPGEPLPQLSFSQDNMTVQRSLVTMMNDLGGDIFSESCCGSESSGEPMRFGKAMFYLHADQITAIQFTKAKLRPMSSITSAHIKLESVGASWSFFASGRGLADADTRRL